MAREPVSNGIRRAGAAGAFSKSRFTWTTVGSFRPSAPRRREMQPSRPRRRTSCRHERHEGTLPRTLPDRIDTDRQDTGRADCCMSWGLHRAEPHWQSNRPPAAIRRGPLSERRLVCARRPPARTRRVRVADHAKRRQHLGVRLNPEQRAAKSWKGWATGMPRRRIWRHFSKIKVEEGLKSLNGGARDGTRTRGLRRDRAAL